MATESAPEVRTSSTAATFGPEGAAAGGRWARVPFGIHALALLVLLLIGMPIVGTASSFSADEGVAIMQARRLARGDGWIMRDPFPALDPSGRDFPLELVDRGANGVAPYAKHPLYPVLLAAADRVGGVNAMIVLSILGTWCAALLAAALARGFGFGRGLLALWIVGAASPLFFDSYLVQAHTLAAAAFALAVWAALRLRRRDGIDPLGTVALLSGTALAILLRSEAVLFVAGLGVALIVDAVRRRRPGAVVAIAVLGVTSAATLLVERRWIRHIVGAAVSAPDAGVASVRGSGLGARWSALRVTWFQPGYGGVTTAVMLLAAAALLVLIASIGLRLGARGSPLVVIGSAGAALLLVSRLFVGGFEPVPGLLIAFPAVLALVALPFRRVWQSGRAAVTAIGAAIGVAAVLATEYPTGGGGEWGGRYFAIGIPLLVLLIVLTYRDRAPRLDGAARRVLPIAFAVGSVALSITGLTALRSIHDTRRDVVAAVAAAAARTDAGDGGSPVVIARGGTLPRVAWSVLDDGRWQLRYGSVEPVLEQAAGLGVTEVVVASPPGTEPVGAGGVVSNVSSTRTVRGWTIETLALVPA